jgi:hypothetical protein
LLWFALRAWSGVRSRRRWGAPAPGDGGRRGCQPRRASGLRMQRAARLAWVGARGGVARRGWSNAADGLKLAMAVLTGTGERLGPGRPGVRPATKARWGTQARDEQQETFIGGRFLPPASQTAPAVRRRRAVRRGHDVGRLGAREPSGRAA